MLLSLFGKRKTTEDELSAKYTLGKLLGEGAFAAVHLATRKSDGTEFAVKLIERGSTSATEAEHEREIIRTLGLHRHIVSLVDHFELAKATALVMELADGGEVFEQICAKGAYSEADAARVVRQVALALAFMHSLAVVHRDLKPENLLLTASGDVKVADFGFAARCGDGHPKLTEVCGTVCYMAPELIACGQDATASYGYEVDVYALGGILFSLLGAYSAFDPQCDRSDEEIMEAITANSWSFSDYPDQWNSISDECKKLIKEMLLPDPKARITADKCLQVPWASGEGANDKPLPNSDRNLLKFNDGRKVWRQAIHAAAVFAAAPETASHHSGATSGKGDESKDLPPLVQAELRTAFELFDLDGNGKIDREEVHQVVRSLGAQEADAARILEEADTDGDGDISFSEFCVLVEPIYRDTQATLRRIFNFFDMDGNGYIDRAELSVVLRKLGFGWQGTHVFEAVDADGDGRVGFPEFMALFGKAASQKNVGGTSAGDARGGRRGANGKAKAEPSWSSSDPPARRARKS